MFEIKCTLFRTTVGMDISDEISDPHVQVMSSCCRRYSVFSLRGGLYYAIMGHEKGVKQGKQM